MTMRLALVLATLLTVGSAAPIGAQQTPTHDTPKSACAQKTNAATPQANKERATVATVVQIDHQHGVLNLETEIGRVLTFAAPEDIKNLHEGDRIEVYLVEEDSAENLSQDTTCT
jgi:hypothetical protein